MAKLQIGVLVTLKSDPEPELRKVVDLGLRSCQVVNWNPDLWTDAMGDKLVGCAKKLDVTISALWTGYPGRLVWNFLEGPSTIGLVPPETRAERVAALKKGADFAAHCRLPAIATHVGFLANDPNDSSYLASVEAIRQVAQHCADRGIGFWFETGQETPVVLLRTIELINTGNLGINLDPANLILYGMANPVDALDVFGQYVRGVHAKDGLYPTDGKHLGKEVPLGEGKVNFPALIPKLKSCGFQGALTIEREISGPQQTADIQTGIKLLEPLC